MNYSGMKKELLPRPETSVVFAGYQAHGTPGRRIQTARPGERVRIDGDEVPVRASIETLTAAAPIEEPMIPAPYTASDLTSAACICHSSWPKYE